MNFEDLLNMKLYELLEDYCYLYNFECDYVYGIIRMDDLEELMPKYDFDEYRDIIGPEPIIPFSLQDEDVLDRYELEDVVRFVGVPRKP